MALLLKDSPDLVLKSGRPKRRRKAAVSEASERTLVSPLALRHPGGRLLYWLIFVLLLVSTLSTLGPLYWVFSGALKPTLELFETPPTFWPMHPIWSNYIQAWNVLQLPLYFMNTLILAGGAVFLQLLVSATAAYALSKLRVAGKGIIQFAFFSTLMVPPIVYLVPQFVNISDLPLINVSLFNSWSGVWLPEAASAFNILLLSRPVLAVVTIFTVIASWKDFLWPLLVLADSNLQPLTVAHYHLSGVNSNLPFNYLVAGLALASIPPILVFLILQRQIIRGVNLTGLKG